MRALGPLARDPVPSSCVIAARPPSQPLSPRSFCPQGQRRPGLPSPRFPIPSCAPVNLPLLFLHPAVPRLIGPARCPVLHGKNAAKYVNPMGKNVQLDEALVARESYLN